ncbi:Mitotic checkpoint serine/threonine-protein kinase BUB1 [Toxocara canis]|uniref:Mitotic checkpoint serine/threonine-protein kinase BUB1 n=1 Tax=Toxocara canis TaxID=6265 RepID=A0A0B2VP08_TOXCA|nr:Mitotic checkpoint serine/threonine-protein kinase BUB1 [Toxocara canis]
MLSLKKYNAMSSFSQLPAFVKTLPDAEQLDYAINHLKWMEEHCASEEARKHLRRFTVETLNRFGQPGCAFYNDEKILYVVLLMGRLSRTIGMKGVLEQVYERGQFREMAEFYVQWAKIYAEEGDQERFDEIQRLAIEAKAQPSSRIDEAFRAMAYENFGAEEFEPTTNLFAMRQQRAADVHMFGSGERAPVVNFASQVSVANKPRFEAPVPSRFATHTPARSMKQASSKATVEVGRVRGLLVADEELSAEERVAATIGYPYPSEPPMSSVMDEEKMACCDEDVAMKSSGIQAQDENGPGLRAPSSNETRNALPAPNNTVTIEAAASSMRPRTPASVRKPLLSIPIPPPRTPPRKMNEDFPLSSPIELGGTSFTEKFYTKAMQEFSNTLPVHPPRAVAFDNETTLLNETEDVHVAGAPVTQMAPPTFDVYRETESFAIKDGHQMDTAGTQTSITKSIQGVPQFDVYKGEDTDSQKMEINKSQLKSAVEVKSMGDTIAPAHGVCSHSREVAEVKTGKESLPEQPHDDVFKKPEGVALHSHKLFAVGASAASTSIPTRAQQSRSIFGVEESGAQKIVDSHTTSDFPDGLDEETVAGSFTNKKSGPVTSTPANPLAPCVQDPFGGDDVINNVFILALFRSAIESEMNPWDSKVQHMIMTKRRLSPTYLHDFSERVQRFIPGGNVVLGGESFMLEALIAEGGFAKIYKSVSEDGKTYAIKYEIPACRWEVYMCEALRLRLPRSILSSVMMIRDAYVYTNASAIVYQYHPYGNLLDMVNAMSADHKSCSGLLVVYLAWQMARILQAVHDAKLIHADVKPDNFMIVASLNENSSLDDVMRQDCFVLKLIDWGRGIDMASLGDRTFKGRAGTEAFDCLEMLDGRPWTYQTDFFGFISTIHVLIFGKYMCTHKNEKTGRFGITTVLKRLALDGRPWTYQTDFFGFISTIHVLIFGKYMCTHKNEKTGRFGITTVLKRRWPQRDVLQDIFDMCLNITDCNSQPQWSIIVEGLAQNIRYTIHGDKMQWKNVARDFNAAIKGAFKCSGRT